MPDFAGEAYPGSNASPVALRADGVKENPLLPTRRSVVKNLRRVLQSPRPVAVDVEPGGSPDHNFLPAGVTPAAPALAVVQQEVYAAPRLAVLKRNRRQTLLRLPRQRRRTGYLAPSQEKA